MQGYTISKPIGQGKFSIVYRAENEQGVAFALKKIKVGLLAIRFSTWLTKSSATSACVRWRSWKSWATPTSSSSSIRLSTTTSWSLWRSGRSEETSRSWLRIRKATIFSLTSPPSGNSCGRSPVRCSTCMTNASCIEIWNLPIFLSPMTAHLKLEIWALDAVSAHKLCRPILRWELLCICLQSWFRMQVIQRMLMFGLWDAFAMSWLS